MVEQSIRKKLDLTVIQICKFLIGKKQGIQNASKTSKMDEIKTVFFGKLAGYKEELIKRIIMKLLIFKVLRESFSTYQVEQTILVYMKLGRQFENFKRGAIRVTLTDCIEKDNEIEYKKQKQKEQRENKKKFK